jgi:hypothetical protein
MLQTCQSHRGATSGPTIRVATGPYAEVAIEAGTEVREGDAIVTVPIPGQGTVDNYSCHGLHLREYAPVQNPQAVPVEPVPIQAAAPRGCLDTPDSLQPWHTTLRHRCGEAYRESSSLTVNPPRSAP